VAKCTQHVAPNNVALECCDRLAGAYREGFCSHSREQMMYLKIIAQAHVSENETCCAELELDYNHSHIQHAQVKSDDCFYYKRLQKYKK